jgi:hypothetical protein
MVLSRTVPIEGICTVPGISPSEFVPELPAARLTSELAGRLDHRIMGSAESTLRAFHELNCAIVYHFLNLIFQFHLLIQFCAYMGAR